MNRILGPLVGRLGPVLLGVVSGVLLLTPIAMGTQPSAEAVACGGEANKVVAEFDLSRAEDLWQHLPAMLRTPELESDGRPAHVVLFADDFSTANIAAMGRVAKPATLNGVVCVVQADGVVNLYYDVARAGSQWAP